MKKQVIQYILFNNQIEYKIIICLTYIMNKQNKDETLDLAKYLDPQLDDKIIALPLEFEYLPVEIISKQFTKLNSNHPYRIHYLGPRFTNTLILHKKYSAAAAQKEKFYFEDLLNYNKYEVQMRKIIQSNYLNEKLQNNHYYKSSIFYRAFQGMNPTLVLKDQFIFNSCFEAGNLDCVIKVSPMEYDLFLRIDSNTRGHTQWFYFSVQNGKKLGKVTFNLCNLTKPKTLYEHGMKPYVFSRKNFQAKGRYWQQDGENVQLSQKRLRYNIVYEMLDSMSVYKLSFDYHFAIEDDQVFIAYSIPYTYSQLLKDIDLLPNKIVKKFTLGRSLGGVDIPILHISNHDQTASKKNILIIGRTHPGQSNGSHVLNGFINFLCSNNEDIIQLRNKINFIIVPMANPDGVIMGNSRSSASGKDLNRQYLTSKKQLYPQVFFIKNLAYKLQKNQNVFMFFDFHGHSRKKNTFFYGPVYSISEPDYYKSRALAKIIEKINHNFRYYSCSFSISEQKKGTARAVMFQRFKIPFVFTVQSSIGLYYDSNKMKTLEFTRQQWQKIGSDICFGLNQFVVAYEQFEEMIAQRRKQRVKRRQKMQKMNKKIKDKKYIEDAIYEDEQGIMLINTNKKGGLMFDMMQQIRQMPQQKGGDPEASSDDHDDAEDLQSSKLREFNNLIIQSKQKDQQEKLNRVCQQAQQSVIQKKVETENDEMQIMKQVTEEKKNKSSKIKLINTFGASTIQNNEPKPFINTAGLQRFTSLHRNVTLHLKGSQKIKANTTSKDNFRPMRKSVNFQTHRHLVSKQFFPVDRCEIVDLPKSSTAMRKDIKKGRVMMDEYLKQKRMQKLLNNQKQEKHESRTEVLRKITHERPEVLTQSVKKIRVEDVINNRMFSQNKGIEKRLLTIKGNNSTNRVFDSVLFSGFQGMEIDNMAMMIRTFNK